jgi:hypothetical protein
VTHRTAAIVVIAGGALMAIGSVLPWLTARTGLGTVSVLGTEGDGVFTLIGGALIALLGLVRLERRPSPAGRFAIVALGLGGLAIGVLDITATNERLAALNPELVAGSIGAGLYVLLLGSVVSIFGASRMGTLGTD